MNGVVSEFKPTPIEAIPSIVHGLHAAFDSQKTKSTSFRLIQLRKLYWGLKDHEGAICSALQRDLGKPTFESFVGEVEWCKNDVIFACNNLENWANDESAPDVPILNILMSPKIRKEPLGCVLIIGAYNVPFQLTLVPLIGAIAAGNTAAIKPSENAPNCSAVIAKIVFEYLDSTCYTCVQGAVAETTALLDKSWDKIFYTGSVSVAKIIAKKAAETLTPCTLELGGKNPAIVTGSANLRLAARRLLWGKIHNAGQICLSQNYTLIDKLVLPKFLSEMKVAMEEFYPDGAKASSHYGRIANRRQWQRLKDLVDTSDGRVLMGGIMDESELFIEPTVMQVNNVNDSLMANETFGPILTIYPVDNLSEAIHIANQVHKTPLATYSFGTKDETDRVLNEIRSGGASVNDAWVHGTVPTLALGGVGDSGSGAYRGRASFECFTHRKSYTTTPSWVERLLALKYPPYDGKLQTYQDITQLRPYFDREGIQEDTLTRYAQAFTHGSLKLAALVKFSLSVLPSTGKNSRTPQEGL